MPPRGETQAPAQAPPAAPARTARPTRRRCLTLAILTPALCLPFPKDRRPHRDGRARAAEPAPAAPPALPMAPGLPAAPDLPVALTGTAIRVLSGDRLLLDDGTRLRLADLEAPWRPPPGSDDLAWPLARAAERRLADRVLGARLTVLAPDLLTDRWGYLHGHGTLGPNGDWLNADRVLRGWARVVPRADSDLATLRTLQRLETVARGAGRGLWAEPFYRVQSLTDLTQGPEGYRLFAGRIVNADLVRDRIYLNFGADWRTDTTLVIAADREPAFRAAGLPPLQLAGRSVRVRGYVTRFDGPRVEIVHPGQIELLDPP